MAVQEIYPNAPIVLMVAEVRHTLCDPLTDAQVRMITTAIRESLPIHDSVQEMSMAFGLDGEGMAPPHPQISFFHTWSSRDRRTVLEVHREMVSLKTTDYKGYADIRELLSLAVQAVSQAEHPTGYTRIGLRYVDEVRVPISDTSPVVDWSDWVSASLLGPTELNGLGGMGLQSQEGVSMFSCPRGSILVLRYGAQDDYVIGSTPQLRRPLPTPGPLFKLDIDSFENQEELVPEFAVDAILSVCDRLHEPVAGVFEAVITEKLRKEVLRNA